MSGFENLEGPRRRCKFEICRSRKPILEGSGGTNESFRSVSVNAWQARCVFGKSRHPGALNQCPLLGVKRTSGGGASMSAFDPKRTLPDPAHCQKFPGLFAKVPITLARWSCENLF